MDTPLEEEEQHLDDDILKNEVTVNQSEKDLELPIPEGSFNLFDLNLNVNLESGFNTDLEKENMAKPVKTVNLESCFNTDLEKENMEKPVKTVNLETGFNTYLEKENMAKPVKTLTVGNKKASAHQAH